MFAQTQSEPALVVHEIVKQFKSNDSRSWFRRQPADAEPSKPILAVDHVSLTVDEGEIFGLLGANGSGKSTIIRMISTLLIPDAGWITVFGMDVTKHEKAVKRLINRVSVEASFFKKLSALENLLYAARLYDLNIKDARQECVRVLAALGLKEKRLYEPLENMSRGMQQKVAIARGLLTKPRMLLLDEPTTGLDPRSKSDVQRFIQKLRATENTTVFLTTHDMDEADRLCDRIAIIDAGKIVALDTPAGLKASINKPNATMEDVFMALTGRSLSDEDFMEEDNDYFDEAELLVEVLGE